MAFEKHEERWVSLSKSKTGKYTVKDFLQLLQTDPKRLQNIIDVPETKLRDIVENAEACVLTNDLYRCYDKTSGAKLELNCAFDIVSVTYMGQNNQLYEIS